MNADGIYAGHGSPSFNDRLRASLHAIAADTHAALGGSLVALVLGGGYGRGEGAVVVNKGIECAYNDLDLTLVVSHRRRLTALQSVAATHAAALGIHVDYSRPLTLDDIGRWPHWLMWHDLLNGHQVLYGAEDVLTAHAPPRVREPVPPIEATRLLLNRGAGLLWARRVVHGIEPPPDHDFVRRNYWKCALSLGDALLIVNRRYTTAYRGRDTLLEHLAQSGACALAPGLTGLYRDAVRFKFSPDGFAPISVTALDEVAVRWQTVFLHVEQCRAGMRWRDIGDYCAYTGIREPEQNGPACWLPNLARNAQLGICTTRHPRERLYRELPHLLVGGPGGAWPAHTARFLDIWRRVN